MSRKPPPKRRRAPKNMPQDVFLYIDTHGGDVEVCWEWRGTVDTKEGRPVFSIYGKKLYVTRLLWILTKGEDVPDGQVIRHKCDNFKCCNPHHHELGTQQENVQDMYVRDRRGLGVEVVREIKRRLKAGGEGNSHQQIADDYKISKSMITKINRGSRYGYITLEEGKEDEDHRRQDGRSGAGDTHAERGSDAQSARDTDLGSDASGGD